MRSRDARAAWSAASQRRFAGYIARFCGLLALAAIAVGCATADAGSKVTAPAPLPTEVVVIPTSTPVPTVLAAVTPVPTVSSEPERVNTVVDPADPPLCLALIPTHPVEGSTGSVAYAFGPDTVEFEYQALYVLNYIGGTALKAGLPGVKSGDQFTFFIDDAMEIPSGEPKIITSLPDGSEQSCAIRWVPGETVEAIEGASIGY